MLHEVSHGYVALYFGDTTARDAHRLTLNPLRHIDWFGSVILPALLIFSGLPGFGYAKPVPVNYNNLRDPHRDSLYVSLIGPVTNFVLSGAGLVVARVGYHLDIAWLYNVGVAFGLANLFLGVFNVLPIPPLDGSAIVERMLPNDKIPAYLRFRQYAMPLLFGILILDSLYFHLLSRYFNDVETWWLNLTP
jgi:Zn-dependent protease